VLSVSVDSVELQRKWEETELSKMVPGGIRFPMISDPDGEIGRRYGVYDRHAATDQRGRFIIDPEGVVQAMEITCDVLGRNVAEILRQLRALQRHRETGELMPCGWEPGKPTLPGEDEAPRLFGKVWKTWKLRNAF
jgi:alkyl hydroperoxide reductase subunit AhpC